MGSDNLFHKRRAKTAQDLRRQSKARQAYAKILIVCEGAKTEPHYFQEAVDYYKLNSANVHISGAGGSAPIRVLEHGLALYQAEKKKFPANPFDKVFFVFDRDTHSTFNQTMGHIKELRPEGTFYAIESVPAFEYWLLLHFVRSTQPFIGKPGKSAGEQLFDKLRHYLPEYEKGRHDTFTLLLPHLDKAIDNAKHVYAIAEATQSNNPSTRIHTLMEILRNLKT